MPCEDGCWRLCDRDHRLEPRRVRVERANDAPDECHQRREAGRVDRSQVPAAVRAQGRRHLRGVRHRRRDRDRQAPGRHGRVRDARTGRRSRPAAGAAAGTSASARCPITLIARRSSTSPAVLLHARPDGREHQLRHHDPRGPGRQDGLLRRGDDLRLLAQRASSTSALGEDLGTAGRHTPTTLPTDRDCADQWPSGRFDFDGWLSSITTVQGAIDRGPATGEGRRPGVLRAARGRRRQGGPGPRRPSWTS